MGMLLLFLYLIPFILFIFGITLIRDMTGRLWKWPSWGRVLIWVLNMAALVFLCIGVGFLFGLQINYDEGATFKGEMLRLTGVKPDAPACAFPEADFFWTYLLTALVAAGAVWALVMLMLLMRKERPRFFGWLLFGCLLFNLVCQAALWPCKRVADGAVQTHRYYVACRAEIERIDALDLDEAERKAFYEATMKKYYLTYEDAEYNYRYMEELLTRLKAYPPAPKE